MKVRILTHPPTGAEAHQYLTSFLIDGTVAVDAGCLGFYGDPRRDQLAVRHILLSHSHIDHLASLPLFLDNIYGARGEPVTVHASDTVLDCLRRDLFNDRLWPNFFALRTAGESFLRTEPLRDGQTLTLDGLRITAVAVEHTVPTLGFVVADDGAAVVIPSDTGPTERIWRVADAEPNLKAVFLEASFPNAQEALALTCKHLTPALFAAELRKLSRPVTAVAVHVKAPTRAETLRDLHALGLPDLRLGRPGDEFEF